MTRRCRWFSMIGAFLTGACLGMIARYVWPSDTQPDWVPIAYIVVGTVGGIWAVVWLAVLAGEKWRRR